MEKDAATMKDEECEEKREKGYVLGLDLGVGSVGWAVWDAKNKTIVKAGVRVVPEVGGAGNFEKGDPIKSDAKERRTSRSTRRMEARRKARRERTAEVLKLLGWLPEHYARYVDERGHIDIEQFRRDGRTAGYGEKGEPKISWRWERWEWWECDGRNENEESGNANGANGGGEKYEKKNGGREDEISSKSGGRNGGRWRFYFEEAFEEMVGELRKDGKPAGAIAKDWTLIYLTKKALTERVSREELAWILLYRNRKRGYRAVRGVDNEKDEKKKSEWKNKLDANNTRLENEGLTPAQLAWEKIRNGERFRGSEIAVIGRNFYRAELEKILEKQAKFYPEFKDEDLKRRVIETLYRGDGKHADLKRTESHRARLAKQTLGKILTEDILYYQRPLKSKKGTIALCDLEGRDVQVKREDGTCETRRVGSRATEKATPLMAEYRVWQWVNNLRIHDEDGKERTDLLTPEAKATVAGLLFQGKKQKKETILEAVAKCAGLKKDACGEWGWNYEEVVDGKEDFRTKVIAALGKSDGELKKKWAAPTTTEAYWMGVDEEKERAENRGEDYGKSRLLARLYNLLRTMQTDEEGEAFVARYNPEEWGGISKEGMRKIIGIQLKDGQGSLSEKALKKLLPVMREGVWWHEADIRGDLRRRIERLIRLHETGELSENEAEKENDEYVWKQLENYNELRQEKGLPRKAFDHIGDYAGLPQYVASYVAYGRHSEGRGDKPKCETPEEFLRQTEREMQGNYLRNPVVERVLRETVRTVGTVWQAMREEVSEDFRFSTINVETARALKNDKNGRKKIIERQEENRKRNKEIQEEIEKHWKQYSPYSAAARDRVRLWEDQGKVDAYTGKEIGMEALFGGGYEIDHIIPQAKWTDDSLDNKVLTQSRFNKEKGDRTGMQYILDKNGTDGAWSPEEYKAWVKKQFKDNKKKCDLLLREDIPEGFAARDLTRTGYITRKAIELLSRVVREDKEDGGANTKNVIVTSGGVTDRLKRDWGINDQWNKIVRERFVKMEEADGGRGRWVSKDSDTARGTIERIHVPVGVDIDKKRIDHRHHAMDAMVIAATERGHVRLINNESSHGGEDVGREDLRTGYLVRKDGKLTRCIKPPKADFAAEVWHVLEDMTVSHREDRGLLRKIGKNSRGENVYAVRQGLHKDTVYGKIMRLETGKIEVKKAVKEIWETPETARKHIADKDFVRQVEGMKQAGYKQKDVEKALENQWEKVEVREMREATVYRVPLEGEKWTVVDEVVDKSIRGILTRYKNSHSVGEKINGEDLKAINEDIVTLNGGKAHCPIRSVRIEKGKGDSKVFARRESEIGVRTRKIGWVETEKNSNKLIYVFGEQGKDGRQIVGVTLREVVHAQQTAGRDLDTWTRALLETLRQDGRVGKNARLIGTLSPGDVVYMPSKAEREAEKIDIGHLDKKRIFRVKKYTVTKNGAQVFFRQINLASPLNCEIKKDGVKEKIEEKAYKANGDELYENESIKEYCIKLKTNRLGKVTGYDPVWMRHKKNIDDL